MTDRYILEGKHAVACEDLMIWARWLENSERSVAKTNVGPYLVSTVFLGLDHSFGGGSPVLFETMVFRRPRWIDLMMDRYSTWEEAESGHALIVAKVRAMVDGGQRFDAEETMDTTEIN